MTNIRIVPYTLRWRPGTVAAGAHVGTREGSGGAFRGHTSLLRHPDPRRIDLRVTLQDPMGGIHVRQFSQRSAVDVIALVDLSGSMSFVDIVPRPLVVAELCAVLAASAHKMGDRFGLIGCDAGVREDVFVAPTRRRGLDLQVMQLLARQLPTSATAVGLVAGARRIPVKRSFVFLLSDFLMPLEAIDNVLSALWRHDVVPVVFGERNGLERLPEWRLAQLRDLETGRRRLLLLRPSVMNAWRRLQEEHHEALRNLFARHGRAPLRLFDRLDVEALASYLSAR